ncbi:MAG: hypothetical protein H6779_01735 [Candidatus Nomurabacteria bacterium]|nr:hypothetical protein [Candidatus Nomurabacteria bacterium]USN88149.1 MAG: hypothetical protein H6779_01735 [Candidatus Nomurabacteria bacterium]
MKEISSTITVQNKKYSYIIKKKNDVTVRVICEAAKINQDFLSEDVPNLLLDLPNLILAEKEHKAKQSETLRFRVSAHDKNKIEQKAVKAGFDSVSDYLRYLALT